MSFGGFGGGSGFGSNNNNNQQQSGSLFGNSSSGFGSNTGFGAANNNNNAGGGLFGSANNNNNNSTGFGSGGFGANTTNNAAGGGLFGSSNANNNRPSFGSTGGAFGSNTTSGFGGGSAFGSTGANAGSTTSGFGTSGGGGLFGNSNNNNTSGNTTGFGASNTGGGGIFGGGNNNTNTSSGFGSGTSGFGASASGFGANNTTPQNPPGTGVTPYQAVIENDGASNIKNHFQSIAFQDPYKGFSFEELREVDYAQGRQYGNPNGQAGAFGTSAFGGQTSSGFGSSNTGGFGGGGFGGAQNNTTSSGFGSNANAGGGGLFGNANKPATGGLFGSSAATSQPTGGSIFGTSGTNTTNTGFGQNNNSGGGLFGNSQNKTGFGATNTGSAFGSSTNTGGGGLFGNNAQSNTNTTGGFGGFGQNNQQQQQNQPSAFGGFGQNNQNNQSGGLFGNKPAQSSGGLFGSSTTNNNQAAGGGLFGNSNNATQQQTSNSGGLFGSKPAQSGGLFGGSANNNSGGGSLFGNNNQQQQNNSGGGLFGPKPATGGLFGGNNSGSNTGGGGGLFGSTMNSNTTQQQQNQGGGIFGSNNQSSAAGQSLFGGSLAQPQQPQQSQQLTASMMSGSPYGNEHLFASLGSTQPAVGPLATPLNSSQKPRKPAPLPVYKMNPAASTRLITPQKKQSYGFSYSTYGTPGSAYTSSTYSGNMLSPSFGRTLTKSLSSGSLRGSFGAEDSVLSPNAFSPGSRAARSSGSMKKLQINRNLRIDLFDSPSDNARSSPLKKAVSFDDDNATEVATTAGESSTALVRVDNDDVTNDSGYLRSSASGRGTSNGSATASPEADSTGRELAIVPEKRQPSPTRHSRQSSGAAAKSRVSHEDAPLGSYWMAPSLPEIMAMSRSQRAQLDSLIVGRVGAGKVKFHQPDLTNVDPDEIMDTIVRFAHRSITVYDDHDNKPEVGKGLNVPSTVFLENSWPRIHGGRSKVFDKSGTKVDRHIERLRRIPDTKFVRFDNDTGTWVFDVEHFSSYEMYDDEDVSMASMPGAIDDASSPLAMKRRVQQVPIPEPSSPLDGYDDLRTSQFLGSRSVPGGFDTDNSILDHINTSELGNNESFLGGEMQVGEDTAFPQSTTSGASSVNVPPQLDGPTDIQKPRHTPTRDLSFRPRSIMKQSLGTRSVFGTPARPKMLLDEENWAGQLQRTLSPKKQDRQVLRENQERLLQGLQPLQPDLPTSNNDVPFANSMDVMNSLFGTSTHARKHPGNSKDLKWPASKRTKTVHQLDDVEHEFHSAFPPRWTHNGSLITAPHEKARGWPKQGLTRNRINVNGQEIEWQSVFMLPTVTASFEKQRLLSVIDMQDDVPKAHLPSTFAFRDLETALAEGRRDLSTHEEQTMWSLAQILFESQDPDVDENATRKRLFAQLWKSVVTPSALNHGEKAETKEEKALAHLSNFEVWGATEALLDGNDSRLATAIAQIGGDADFRSAVKQQIDHWRETNDLSEIPARIRALYELLAGNTCISQGTGGKGPENEAETFNISKKFGLDWRRAFGLRLWYGILSEEPLSAAINSYEADLKSGREVIPPVPAFAEKSALVDGVDSRQDILFGLMKIYTTKTIDIPAVLSPENTSGDPLNTMLSFQLMQALSVRGIIPAASTLSSFSDSLTETLVAQLSAQSETLHQAVFAALHFTSATKRAHTVQSLLAQHAGSISLAEDGPDFEYLTRTLSIPARWIHIALAQYALAVRGDAALQSHHLLAAGDIEGAVIVLARTVAPLAVIEERITELRTILVPFKSSTAPKLAAWRDGAGLYADFAELVEKAGGVAAVRPAARPRIAPGALQDVHSLVRRVRSALPRGEAWSRLGMTERAAVVEMGTVVTRVESEITALRGGVEVEIGTGGTQEREDKALKRAKSLSQRYFARVGLVA